MGRLFQAFLSLCLTLKLGDTIFDTSVLFHSDIQRKFTFLYTALSHSVMTTCFDNQQFLYNDVYPNKSCALKTALQIVYCVQ